MHSEMVPQSSGLSGLSGLVRRTLVFETYPIGNQINLISHIQVPN